MWHSWRCRRDGAHGFIPARPAIGAAVRRPMPRLPPPEKRNAAPAPRRHRRRCRGCCFPCFRSLQFGGPSAFPSMRNLWFERGGSPKLMSIVRPMRAPLIEAVVRSRSSPTSNSAPSAAPSPEFRGTSPRSTRVQDPRGPTVRGRACHDGGHQTNASSALRLSERSGPHAVIGRAGRVAVRAQSASGRDKALAARLGELQEAGAHRGADILGPLSIDDQRLDIGSNDRRDRSRSACLTISQGLSCVDAALPGGLQSPQMRRSCCDTGSSRRSSWRAKDLYGYPSQGHGRIKVSASVSALRRASFSIQCRWGSGRARQGYYR